MADSLFPKERLRPVFADLQKGVMDPPGGSPEIAIDRVLTMLVWVGLTDLYGAQDGVFTPIFDAASGLYNACFITKDHNPTVTVVRAHQNAYPEAGRVLSVALQKVNETVAGGTTKIVLDSTP